MFGFGAGNLYGQSNAPGSTPVLFGGLQEISVDFSATTKELFSQYQFPIAVGRGTAKIDGKAVFAKLSGHLINDLFFNNVSGPSAGRNVVVMGEAGTLTVSSYTTVNAANFTQDLGVVDGSTGAPFVLVAGSPAAGQYSVASGVYTFNVADNGKTVQVSYVWHDSATGQSLTITNPLLGTAPQFKTVLTQAYNNVFWSLTLNACMSSKLTFATKLEDFIKPDFTFAAMSDSANIIGSFSFATAD